MNQNDIYFEIEDVKVKNIGDLPLLQTTIYRFTMLGISTALASSAITKIVRKHKRVKITIKTRKDDKELATEFLSWYRGKVIMKKSEVMTDDVARRLLGMANIRIVEQN